MSILIKGVMIPKDCTSCPCFIDEYMYCNTVKRHISVTSDRPKFCPLVEVPEPHGRLIDADALSKKAYHRQTLTTVADMINDINNAPTVIEAEGEE